MSSLFSDMASNLSRYGLPDLLELQVPESRLRQTPLAGSASLGLSDPELRQTRARGSAPRSSRRPGRSGSPDLSRWGAADSWIRGVQPSRRIWRSGGEDGNPAPSPVSPESGFLLETAISGLPARSPDPGGRGGGVPYRPLYNCGCAIPRGKSLEGQFFDQFFQSPSSPRIG